MSRFVLDAATAAKLRNLAGSVELVDEFGAVLGVCALNTAVGFTDEEIRLALQQTGPGITTEELIRRLRSR